MPCRRFALLFLFVFAFLSACTPSRPSSPSTDAGGSIAGLSRVPGATVAVYRLDNAQRGAQVGTGSTAADGSFSVPVGVSEGPFVVVLTGGSTVDEASGAAVQLNSDELTALVPSFPVGTHLDRLIITPVSHLAAGLALRTVQAGSADVAAASEEAWRYLNAHFGGFDWRRTFPADVTAATSVQLDDAAKAGLILAGLSQEALTLAQQAGLTPGASVTGFTLTEALHEDLIADGFFDGVGQDGRRLVLPAAGALSPSQLDGQAVRTNLAAGIAAFLSNPRRTLPLTLVDVQPLLDALSRSSSEHLFRDAGRAFDVTPPTVSVRVSYQGPTGAFLPASGSPPYVRGRIQLEVDASDDSSVRALSASQAGVPLTPVPSATSATRYVGTWDASLAPDGELVFNVTAVDGRGNTGVTPVKVLVDNTPPAVSLAQPSSSFYASAVRVEASATDSGAGVASLAATGLPGFVDDASAPDAVRGVWTVPPAQADGPVSFTLAACDGVGNCTSTPVTVQVDRTPPSVTLAAALPRYTTGDSFSFSVEASDATSPVSAVHARRIGGSSTYTAQQQQGPSGLPQFSFQELPLTEGLNTFEVWAEDATNSAPPSQPLVVVVSRDTSGPLPNLEGLVSYRDERSMDFQRNSDGTPRLPLLYVWPDDAGKAWAAAGVYKASTRLSWGPAAPTSAELEGENSQNVPFLSFSAQRAPDAEAPIVSATYSLSATCERCSSPSTYSGNLLASPRSTEQLAAYLLPLTRETVPLLGQLPSSPAHLTIAVTFHDSVGNEATWHAALDYHVLGAPLSVVEDTGYAARGDSQSEYGFSVSKGTYGGVFGGAGNVRILRYVLHNPAPVAVPVAVNMSGAWAISETWQDFVSTPTDASWVFPDGRVYQRSYNWFAAPVAWATPSSAPAAGPLFPCGATGVGPAATQYPARTVASPPSQSAFDCVPNTISLASAAPRAASTGALAHAAFLEAPSGAVEATSPAAWARGYWVPPQSRVVLYVVRSRTRSTTSSAYSYWDLRDGRGPRIQTWVRDFWVPTTTTDLQECSSNGLKALCVSYSARRQGAELVSANNVLQGQLDIQTAGGEGGETRAISSLKYDKRGVTY